VDDGEAGNIPLHLNLQFGKYAVPIESLRGPAASSGAQDNDIVPERDMKAQFREIQPAWKNIVVRRAVAVAAFPKKTNDTNKPATSGGADPWATGIDISWRVP
jgi:hypothetical protein